MVGGLAGYADKGHLAQLAFHHPLEVASQESIDQEDIEGSLVVAHKDIRLPSDQVFAPLDLDWQEQDAHDKPCPPFAGIIAPEVSATDRASDDHGQSREDGDDDDEWESEEELIQAVEIFHCRWMLG